MTLFGYYQVFGEGDYPGPAMLGMLLAAGIAMGARRLGLGTMLTFASSVLGLMIYVCFVFQTDLTLYGMPTLEALRAVARSLGNAAEKAALDFAPVPVRAGYVIMIVTGMWAATTIAEVATFRWKRPLLASFPSIALFAAGLVFGTGQGAGPLVALFLAALLTFWGLESSHRLRSWGRWVPTFPGISSPEEEPSSVTGSIARRMGAATVAAALVAPIFLPALGDGLVAWRTGVGGGGSGGQGGGSSGRIDPFVSIAPRLLQQTDVELFTVESDRATYWRLVTLGKFDGATWSPVDVADESVVGGELGPPVPESARSSELEVDFTLTNLEGDYLPTLGSPRSIEIADDLLDDLRRAQSTGDVRIETQISEGLTYGVAATIPDITYTDLLSAQPGAPGADYLQLPPMSKAVEDFLERTTIGIPEDQVYRQLVAIQNRLRNTNEFTYSTAPSTLGARGASIDYLTTFLTRSKEGYCQQYATAFALLARRLGVPSRVVVGFLPGESVPAQPRQRIVRGTDAHAWPEVYLEDWGWIPFEPTPRSSDSRVAIAPTYTQPGSNATGAELGAATGNRLGGGVDPRNVRDDFQVSAAEREALRSRLGALFDRGRSRPQPEAPWKTTFARLAFGLLVATLLFLVTVPALKEWRIKRRYARAHDSRDLTAAAYDEFLMVAAELASPKGMAESARAYASRLSGAKKLPQDRLMRLASLYEAAEFGRSDPDSGVPDEAKSLAREVRARLWHAASWWSRLARLFSLHGLRAGRSGLGPAR